MQKINLIPFPKTSEDHCDVTHPSSHQVSHDDMVSRSFPHTPAFSGYCCRSSSQRASQTGPDVCLITGLGLLFILFQTLLFKCSQKLHSCISQQCCLFNLLCKQHFPHNSSSQIFSVIYWCRWVFRSKNSVLHFSFYNFVSFRPLLHPISSNLNCTI